MTYILNSNCLTIRNELLLAGSNRTLTLGRQFYKRYWGIFVAGFVSVEADFTRWSCAAWIWKPFSCGDLHRYCRWERIFKGRCVVQTSRSAYQTLEKNDGFIVSSIFKFSAGFNSLI